MIMEHSLCVYVSCVLSPAASGTFWATLGGVASSQDGWSFSPAQYYRETPKVLGPVWVSQYKTWTDWSQSSKGWQKGSEYTTCEEQPRQLGLVSLEKKTVENLIHVNKHWGAEGAYDGGAIVPSDSLHNGAQ